MAKIRTRSQFEETIINNLKGRRVKFKYEPHKIAYIKSCTYTPDLLINNFYIELKGRFTPADRAKHILIKRQKECIEIRFVFQNAYNKLSKKSKTTYAEWCDKNGFKWAHKEIPKEWLRFK